MNKQSETDEELIDVQLQYQLYQSDSQAIYQKCLHKVNHRKEKIMSKIKEMYEVITQLRECATALTETADFLVETFSSNEEPSVQEPPKEKAISLEDVRGVLADKSRSGKTAEVKALITSFGADKLSSVNPSDYAELLKKAEAI